MTADDIEKYINQIAFSGAEEFLAKYKDKAEKYNRTLRTRILFGFHGGQEG